MTGLRWLPLPLLATIALLLPGAACLLGADANHLVRSIRVQPDRAPDCTSLKAIAETVTRGATNNDQRAIALYNFMQLTHYHHAYPNEPGGVPALKAITCYGWSLCGGLHATESALWRELGWRWRFVGWNNPGHTTVEAEYDGRWHYLDVFLKFYAWMPDGQGGFTIAGENDLKANPQTLLTDAFELDGGRNCVYVKGQASGGSWQVPTFLSCGDTLPDVVKGIASSKSAGSPDAWGSVIHRTGNYSAAVDLAPGFSLENSWDPHADAWYFSGSKNPPGHTCSGHKDTRNDPASGLVLEPYVNDRSARSFANGRLVFAPDFKNPAALQGFIETINASTRDGALVPVTPGTPASVTARLTSPYVITKCLGEAQGAEKVELSIDDGKSFKSAALPDLTAAIKGQVAALVRVTFREALRSLRLEATVQNNPGALPFLSPGRNQVLIAVADPAALGANELVVTYAWRLGARTKSLDKLFDEGKEIARQHNAKWSDTITFVQRRFAAKDLPATVTVDCPTTKGRYPVYPRMVLLRREIVPPGGQPLPPPPGAVPAKPAAGNEELAELPNPFLVGAKAPAPAKALPVKTTRIPLSYIQFVDETGAVADTGLLRWPKVAQEQGKVIAGAVLFAGEFKDIPRQGVTAARLVVPIKQGHDKASTKVGVVPLQKPITKGTAFEFKSLTAILGTATLPKQPAESPEYSPPKPLSIEVTRLIKSIAAGDTVVHGFALRVVPDRAVDEGWTVRCTISSKDPAWLEVDTRLEAPNVGR